MVVLVWPVGIAELPRWLEARLGQAKVRLTPGALGCLAERVEGNLLAAVQEIEKLRLADLEQPITEDTLLGVLEDASHYGTFELLNALYAGDRARVARMVRGLRTEGVALFAILGALTSQIRMLQVGPQALNRMPPMRRRLLEQFVRRLGNPSDTLDRVLAPVFAGGSAGQGSVAG